MTDSSIFIAFSISCFGYMISTMISCLIISLVWFSKTLRTPSYLLISNTCVCTLINTFTSILNNYYFYFNIATSDWSCRIRGYLYYVGILSIMLSYLVQAISRLFHARFYQKRSFLTIQSHIYLILIQHLLSVVLPVSSLITDHIRYRPMKSCGVAMKYTLHVYILLFIEYILPFTLIIILYGFIYHSAVSSTLNSHVGTIVQYKRDTELARKILILFFMFILGGVPTIAFMIVTSKTESVPWILFLISITSPPIAIALEKNDDFSTHKRFSSCFNSKNINTSMAISIRT